MKHLVAVCFLLLLVGSPFLGSDSLRLDRLDTDDAATPGTSTQQYWTNQPFLGGGPSGPALNAALNQPGRMAFGDDGTLYVALNGEPAIVAISPDGEISLVADSVQARQTGGVPGPIDSLSADGSPTRLYYRETRLDPTTGTYSQFFFIPSTPSVVQGGTAFVTTRESFWSTIYRLVGDDSATYVGGCLPYPCRPFTQDGQLATETYFAFLDYLALERGRYLYLGLVRDILRLDLDSGALYRHGGGGRNLGEGVPASDAAIFSLGGLQVDPSGNVVYLDQISGKIRRIDRLTGLVHTIVSRSDGLSEVGGFAFDASGTLFVSDTEQNQVYRWDGASLIPFAGTGQPRYFGELRQAAEVMVDFTAIEPLSDGRYLASSNSMNQIYLLDPSDGTIQAVAGTGDEPDGNSLDGVDALFASFKPSQLGVAVDDTIYFSTNDAVYRFNLEDPQLQQVAGSELVDFSLVLPDGRLLYNSGPFRSSPWSAYDPETGAIETLIGGGFVDPFPGALATDVVGIPDGRLATSGEDGSIYITTQAESWRLDPVSRRLFKYVTRGAWNFGDPFVEKLSRFGLPAQFPLVIPNREGENIVASVIGGIPPFRINPFSQEATEIAYAPTSRVQTLRYRSQIEAAADHGWLNVTSRALERMVPPGSPPIAVADGTTTVNCVSSGTATVSLDASASYDPDDTLELADIDLHWWYLDYEGTGRRLLAKGEFATASLPIGTHEVTLVVRDRAGYIGTDSYQVVVDGLGDPDQDGVDSCIDNCPEVANSGQEDGDENSLGDVCDPCFASGESDADGDRVCDMVDNCVANSNADQSDFDADGLGDACDPCRFVRGSQIDDRGVCVVSADDSLECVSMSTNANHQPDVSRVEIYQAVPKLPSAVVLTLGVSRCSSGDTFEFRLNGVEFGPFSLPAGPCVCAPFGSTISLPMNLVLPAWNATGENRIELEKVSGDGHLLVAQLQIESEGETVPTLIYFNDFVCDSGSQEPFSTTVTLASLGTNSVLLEDRQLWGALPAATVQADEPGIYSVCTGVSAQDGVGSFVGMTQYGELFEIDPFDGAAHPIGVAGAPFTSVLYRDQTESFYLGDGAELYPISTDGTVDGAIQYLASPFDGFAFGENDQLLLVEDLGTFQDRRGTVLRLNDDGSFDELFRSQQTRYGSVAFDGATGDVAAVELIPGSIRGGTIQYAGETSQQPIDGPALTGIGLARGPAGGFYAANIDDGTIYRVAADGLDPIGESGVLHLISMTYAGPSGERECRDFELETGQRLELNRSCGAPEAVISALGQVTCGDTVILDASSTIDVNDPDNLLVGDLTYRWYLAGSFLGEGERLEATLLPGTSQLTLEVENQYGERSTASASVDVVDDTPPMLDLTLSPAMLWPPNGKFHDIEATLNAEDACGDVRVELLSIDVNQQENSPFTDAEFGTDDRRFKLRARRAGSSDRIYTVTYRATDDSGNSVEKQAQVRVPHDRRRPRETTERNLKPLGRSTDGR